MSLRWFAFAFAALVAAGVSHGPGALAQSPPGTVTSSWIGNTFGGANSKWVQLNIDGVYVSGDGTVYCNTIWDEDGRELGIYRNGDLVSTVHGSLHGWGRSGGQAIVANGSYIYLAMGQNGDDGANTNNNQWGNRQYPDANNIWYCVRRYDLSGNPAGFGANGFDGSMRVVASGSRPAKGSPYSGQGLTGS